MNSFTTNKHNYKGFTISVDWHYDTDHGAPWREEDGHGPVSDWTGYNPGCGDGGKRPGQRVLCEDSRSVSPVRFYDWQEAIKEAKRDGWGLTDSDKAKLASKLGKPVESLTRGEIVNEAVQRDFDYLRAWCNNDWYYVGYVVTIEGDNGEELPWDEMGQDSLWGIDSPSMDEFEQEAIGYAQTAIDTHLAERAEIERFSEEVQLA